MEGVGSLRIKSASMPLLAKGSQGFLAELHISPRLANPWKRWDSGSGLSRVKTDFKGCITSAIEAEVCAVIGSAQKARLAKIKATQPKSSALIIFCANHLAGSVHFSH